MWKLSLMNLLVKRFTTLVFLLLPSVGAIKSSHVYYWSDRRTNLLQITRHTASFLEYANAARTNGATENPTTLRAASLYT